MNLKDSEAYHRPTGSKYLVGSSSAPYCNRKYPTHILVMDARTQHMVVMDVRRSFGPSRRDLKASCRTEWVKIS